jgi:hypothetical protein
LGGFVRDTIIINSRLAWRRVRGVAAIQRRHGLQALSIQLLAARLAGGFLQAIDSDALKTSISRATEVDLGELNEIKHLPGFARAAAATLSKAWTSGIDLRGGASDQAAAVPRRTACLALLEAEVLRHLPPSMRRPSELVGIARTRVHLAESFFGRVSVHGHTEMAPVWRPMLGELAKVVDLSWVAGPRKVPSWVGQLGIPIIETPPETPVIECRSCGSPRHEALEAMRWARSLIASGKVRPEDIAIAAASPEEWDDHLLALSDMSGLDLHFVHGRKVLTTSEGQLAAALAEVLLRGFSHARMTRLVGLLRNQNPAFQVVPSNWWHELPQDAPLLGLKSWRDTLAVWRAMNKLKSDDVIVKLNDLIEALSLGLKQAKDIGERLLVRRSLAIWRKALTEGPPEALDVTLSTLRLPDLVPQEANIIWVHAASLAAEPRPYVWLIGLTSRAWPRRHSEDSLLPDYIVESSLLDPLPVHVADRCDFDTIIRTTTQQVICSYARREAQGRINGISPLFPKSGVIFLKRARIPEHACGWADRLLARPAEFQTTPEARSAISCWDDWNSNRLTAHDGLMRANHPVVVAAVDRKQSTTSLVKLLRDPLGYLWKYGFGWTEPKETEEPLLLDALAFGSLLHATLEKAVTHLETTLQGGLGAADQDDVLEALDVALGFVSLEWERKYPAPPPMIWERKLRDIHSLAIRALTFREEPLPNQQSWAEVKFGSSREEESRIDGPRPPPPWDPFAKVVIPGTAVSIGGSIDRLDLSGTTARVTDYKSGKAPSTSMAPLLKGGAELQRCLYAYAVTALIPSVVTVEARLFFPKAGDDGLIPLSNPRELLEQLATFIESARSHVLAGDLLPGIGAQEEYNDLAFALPGGANESYFAMKSDLVRKRLGGIAPLWELD